MFLILSSRNYKWAQGYMGHTVEESAWAEGCHISQM